MATQNLIKVNIVSTATQELHRGGVTIFPGTTVTVWIPAYAFYEIDEHPLLNVEVVEAPISTEDPMNQSYKFAWRPVETYEELELLEVGPYPQTRMVMGRDNPGDGLGTIMHFYPGDETPVDGISVLADFQNLGRWKSLNLVPGAATLGHLHDSRYVRLTQAGQANGYVPLGGDGKIATQYMSPLTIVDVNVVSSETAQLALTAQEGDIAIRSDQKRTYVHNGGVSGTVTDWSEMQSPTDQVLSVDGRTGALTLTDLYAPLSHASVDASTAVRGHVEIATLTEALTGTAGAPFVTTPAGVKNAIDNAPPTNIAKITKTATAQNSIAAGATAIVTFQQNTLTNPSNFAEQGNNRLVIPVAGWYRVQANVYLGTTVDGSNYQLRLLKNGTETAQASNHSGSTRSMTARLDCMQLFAAGDLLTLQFDNNSSGAVSIPASTDTWLQAQLLGAT